MHLLWCDWPSDNFDCVKLFVSRAPSSSSMAACRLRPRQGWCSYIGTNYPSSTVMCDGSFPPACETAVSIQGHFGRPLGPIDGARSVSRGYIKIFWKAASVLVIDNCIQDVLQPLCLVCCYAGGWQAPNFLDDPQHSSVLVILESTMTNNSWMFQCRKIPRIAWLYLAHHV